MAVTQNPYMDFLIISLSLFNGILLLWLGLTVLLNAQHRSWGLWIAGCGLIMGSLFFMLHSTVLGVYPNIFTFAKGFWWQIGIGMVILLPLAWYIDILWYTGFTEKSDFTDKKLNRAKWIHRNSIRLLFGVFLLMVGIVTVSIPWKSLLDLRTLNIYYVLSFKGTHVSMWLFTLFILICMILSIYALRFPVPSGRLMGDEARKRALPFLLGATISLFFVTVVVIFAFLWVESELRTPSFWINRLHTIALFDILLNFLILISVFLIGQAVCSYEVYTGETLPRRGLMRYWTRTILLGAGFSSFAAFALIRNIQTIYIILFSAVLMIVFFGTLTWRLFIERETLMKQLRPFVNSQQLYQQAIQQGSGLLSPTVLTSDSDQTLPSIFFHLCGQILLTEYAYLATNSHLLSIQHYSLEYPIGASNRAVITDKINRHVFVSDQEILIEPVVFDEFEKIKWAVPLWSEIGRIGTLFLGKKLDDSLYTLEEIEIARAACERLLDTKASLEMTKHLMTLQRAQLTQSQILDQRARQLLHDEVLPELHALMIEISTQNRSIPETAHWIESLQQVHKRLSEMLHALPSSFSPEISRHSLLRAIENLPELINEDCFERVDWQITPDVNQHFERLPIQIREILYFATREIIRNAASHGVGANGCKKHVLEIEISANATLQIAIKDYGCGVDIDQYINRIVDGGGKGLSIHQTMMAIIGGNMLIESVPGQFTKVILRIPNSTNK